jgi:hypothetical protein
LYFNEVPEPERAKNRVHLDLVNPDPSAVDELIRLAARSLANTNTRPTLDGGARPGGQRFLHRSQELHRL